VDFLYHGDTADRAVDVGKSLEAFVCGFSHPILLFLIPGLPDHQDLAGIVHREPALNLAWVLGRLARVRLCLPHRGVVGELLPVGVF
jgi:hypothetical protein